MKKRSGLGMIEYGLIFGLTLIVAIAATQTTGEIRDRDQYREFLVSPQETRMFKYDAPPRSFYFQNMGEYEDWVVLLEGKESVTRRLTPGRILEIGGFGFTRLTVELERTSTLTDKAREIFYRENPEIGDPGPLLIKQNHVLKPEVAQRAKKEGWLRE